MIFQAKTQANFFLFNCVPAHGAVVGAEDGAAVGLAQQLDVLQAEEEAVGGGSREDQRLGRRLGLLQGSRGTVLQIDDPVFSALQTICMYISGYLKDHPKMGSKDPYVANNVAHECKANFFAWLQSDTFNLLDGHTASVAIFIEQNRRPHNRNTLLN